MTKILHMSDTHLGCMHYGLKERIDDFRRAYMSGIDYAIEQNYDAVIHTGDLFHHNKPRPSAVQDCIDGIKKLNKNDIPMYFILGNHESLSVSEFQWIDMICSVTGAKKLSTEPTVVGDISIYGVDYMRSVDLTDLEFEECETDFAILCLHQEISDMVNYDSSSTSKEELTQSIPHFIDYVALGDIHKFIREDVDGLTVSYAGSPERTQISQKGPRTYAEIKSDNGSLSVSPINLEDTPNNSPREVQSIDINIDPSMNDEDIYQSIRDESSNLEDCILELNVNSTSESVSSNDIKSVCDELGVLTTRINGMNSVELEDIDSISELSNDISDVEDTIERVIVSESRSDDMEETLIDIVSGDIREDEQEYFEKRILGDKNEN